MGAVYREMKARTLLTALLAALPLAGCPGEGALPGGGATASPTGKPTLVPGAMPYTVHIGPTLTGQEEQFEAYDTRRSLWITLAEGLSGLEAPKITAAGPPGVQPPAVYEPVFVASARAYKAKARFYEPGSGYKLTVVWTSPEGAVASHSIDLPDVRPATRRWGDLEFTFSASPSLGRIFQPNRFSLVCRNVAGEPASPSAALRLFASDPCGWSIEGTFSADPSGAGLFTFEPASASVENAGDYRLRIYPSTAQATYIDFPWEAK